MRTHPFAVNTRRHGLNNFSQIHD